MKRRKVVGEQNSSASLMELLRTDVVQRHLHRFNMVTTSGGVFIALVFVMQFDCEHFQHEGLSCMSARTSCSDLTSASSPQPFVFGKSSALLEACTSCGTMDSSSMKAST